MKLDRFLEKSPEQSVFLTSYFMRHGFSKSLLNYYKKENKINYGGHGWYWVGQEKPSIFPVLSVLQNQSNVKIHIGGIPALALSGKSHFIS